MESVANELDYKQVNISRPTYILSQITQQSGAGNDIIVTTSGGQESIFEIPTKVINLSRSILTFDSSSQIQAPTTEFMWAHVNGITHIQQLQLYNRNGLFLADITDVNKYTNMVMRYETHKEEPRNWDMPVGNKAHADLAAEGPDGGYLQGLRAVAFGAGLPQRHTGGTTQGTTAYNEPAYMLPGVISTLGTNAAYQSSPSFHYAINLGKIYNSIFSVDKDLYFGDTVYLRIIWAPSTKTYFSKAHATDPVGGVATTRSLLIKKLKLYLCIEQNQVIVDSIVSRVNSPETLTVQIPFIYSNKLTLNGTSQTVSVRYSSANGQLLKKIFIAPYNIVETGVVAYDHSNLASVRVTEYYTMMNNVRRQQFNYRSADGTDYFDKRHLFEGSCINNSDEFYYNFVHIEDFTNQKFADRYTKDDSNQRDGLVIGNEMKFDFVANTPAIDNAWYVYAVTLKTLSVGSAGISIY